MTTLRQPRGNALLITVVALAVLMVLVVGAIRFTGTNRASAGAKLSADRVAACAEVARRTLISRLRVSQKVPTEEIKFDEAIVDDINPVKQSRILTAHYGGAQAATVLAVSSSQMSGTKRSARGLSNVLVESPTGGGQYFSVTVLCREAPPSTREAEVEYLFRYGAY
ncbi:MAG: hypothetical protein QM765_50680 [Myxococcales bacterium]